MTFTVIFKSQISNRFSCSIVVETNILLKMTFDIEGKVALITGGASGIGLRYAKELLKNGLRGVTLADVNEDFGEAALKDIETEFGPKKAIFVKTDVTDYNNFEEAFKKTIDEFKNIDILINNAGILNDAIWEKQIAINLNGTIHGVLLGLEHYIPKHKTGTEGVIVNISSIAGVKESPVIPVYSATKFAILGLSKSWGVDYHFERSKVRVLVICPGVTDTPLISDMSGRNLGEPYETLLQMGWNSPDVRYQKAESVALAMVEIIRNAGNGTAWVAEGGDPPYEFVLPERQSFAVK